MIGWSDPLNRAEDGDRLTQDVLSELGWDADQKKIAENVRELDLGLPAEDEFIAVSSWLGHVLLDVEIVGTALRLIMAIKYPIHSEAFRCASEAMKAIDDVAEALTGNRKFFYDHHAA